MVSPVTPNREALFKLAAGDNRLMIALEQLFDVTGVTIPGSLEELTELVAGNSLEAAIKTQLQNGPTLDSIQFDLYAPVSEKVGQISWDELNDTMQIVHEGGVVQEVGQEVYALVENNTGSTLPNGTVVGVAGAGINERVQVEPYIADGTRTSLNLAGVMTQELPDSGSRGRLTVWGHVRGIDTTGAPVGETWAAGDTLYASPTTAGAFTNIKPTAPDVVVPVAFILAVDASEGVIFVRPAIEQQQYYGSFLKEDSATPAAINTAYPITLTTAYFNNGVSIGTPTSRIVFDNAGLYNLHVNFQFQSNSSSPKDVYFWFRQNGVDVANSTYIATNTVNNGYFAVSRNRNFSVAAGDYIELYWAADSTNVTLISDPATAFAPASPAVELEVVQVQQ